MTTTLTLVLENQDERHPGLTKSIAGGYCEAAGVCLDRHHASPEIFKIKRKDDALEAQTVWAAPDQRTKNAWANTTDATEAGAYGVAIATIEATDGLVVVHRAEVGTGADYYLGSPKEKFEDLEKSLRLEVSGIDESNPSALKARLGVKIKQCQKGDSALPAITVVVGFSSLAVVTADVEME